MRIRHVTYDAVRPENTRKRLKDYIQHRMRESAEIIRYEDQEPLLHQAIVPLQQQRMLPHPMRPKDVLVTRCPISERVASQQDHLGIIPDVSRIQAPRGRGTDGALDQGQQSLEDSRALLQHDTRSRPALRRKDKIWRPMSQSTNTETDFEVTFTNDHYSCQSSTKKTGHVQKLLPPLPVDQQTGFKVSDQKSSCWSGTPQFEAHKKSSFTSSKIGCYLGTSADLLDATRRDFIRNAERAFAGLELITRLSQNMHVDSEDESDSDDSFFCVGEKLRPCTARLQELRRLSGASAARDPWTDDSRKECRLCQKNCIAGIRGLCQECETEFRRPRSKDFQADVDEQRSIP